MSWFSIGAGLIGAIGQDRANKAAQSSAQAQMAFQERMTRNAHRYAVADLKAAGLNPILAANQPAATPQGSSYKPDNVAGGLADNVNAARQIDLNRKSVTSMIDLNSASAREKEALTAEATERTRNYAVERDLKVTQQAQNVVDTLKSQVQTEAARQGIKLTARQMAEIDARIESLQSGIALTLEKINTEKTLQTANLSSAGEHAARQRNIEQDTNLKSNREKVEIGGFKKPETNDEALDQYRAILSRWVRALKGE